MTMSGYGSFVHDPGATRSWPALPVLELVPLSRCAQTLRGKIGQPTGAVGGLGVGADTFPHTVIRTVGITSTMASGLRRSSTAAMVRPSP